MANLLIRSEFARFDVQTHLFVSVAERNTLQHEAVYFLYAEQQSIFVIFQDMFVHLHFAHHMRYHANAILQFVESRQEHLFDDLQVAEIARWQVVAY